MKYQKIKYDMNSVTQQQIGVPLNSRYGVAVKVCNDGVEQIVGISVGGVETTQGPDGWMIAELSSGNVQTMKMMDVVAGEEAERETFENTISVRQPLNRDICVTITLGTFLSGVEISPSNVSEFEMSSTLTPDAGGDPITETYELGDLKFYGKAPDSATAFWWKIADGRWSDSLGIVFTDTITLEAIGTRNVELQTNNLYPKSTGTATYKLVFKFGEDFHAKFPLQVVQKDKGYFEI